MAGGPLRALIHVSSVFLWLLNRKESVREGRCFVSLAASLARGIFNHSQKRTMKCYCLTAPGSAVLAFGECLWHALHAKLVDSFLVYSSPKLH